MEKPPQTNNVSDNTPGSGNIKAKFIGAVNGSTVGAAYPNAGILNPIDFSLLPGSLQSFTTASLDANQLYTLTATINTDANVELKVPKVPEPEILALLGMGLLGFAVSSKKKSSLA